MFHSHQLWLRISEKSPLAKLPRVSGSIRTYLMWWGFSCNLPKSSLITWPVHLRLRMVRAPMPVGSWTLYKLGLERSIAFLPINSSYSHSSPFTVVPTFDIMSSSNNVRPSLYVSTTPVDQEGEVPITWNMMRNNVQPMLLEVSDVFQ